MTRTLSIIAVFIWLAYAIASAPHVDRLERQSVAMDSPVTAR